MKVLVTGGAGYVGQSLINLLNKNNNITEIIVYDNISTSNVNFFIGKDYLHKVLFVKGDILNFDLLKKYVSKVNAVYHLASYTTHAYTYAQNIQYEQINQWVTLNLVRAIKESNSEVNKLFYLSSLAIYGFNKKINFKLDNPQPANAYSISKYEAEKYVKLLADDNCTVHIVRSGNVFGLNNGFRKDSVLNNFIFNAIVNKKILIYGDGQQSRPFVHVDNISEILANEIENINKQNVIYDNVLDFNASMNEIKDWLLTLVNDLEYTYLNTNIKYDSHLVLNAPSLSDSITKLNNTFHDFYNNIRIRAL